MSGWLTPGLTQSTPANYQGNSAPAYPVDQNLPNGASPETVAMPLAAVGVGNFNTVSAAGTTLGGATALTAFKNVITVATTASTHGVKLPTAVTGLAILVVNAATFGVKVYANAAGQSIGAGTTATTAVVQAINKASLYLAISATKWIAFNGA